MSTDPFGDDRATQLWRRLAGVSLLSSLLAGATAWRMPSLLPWIGLATAVAVLLGTPLSWWATRPGRPVRTVHAVAGGGLGAAFGVWAAWWAPYPAAAVLTGVLAVAVGAGVAAGAAHLALCLPRAALRPLATLGLVASAGVVGVAVWVLLNPVPPTDLVALDATDEVEEEFGDGLGLGEAIADAYEPQLAVGPAVLGTPTWASVVSAVLDQPLGETRAQLRATANVDLPTDPSTGEPWRLVDTVVRDRGPQACVVVTARAVEVRRGACERLDPR